MLQYPSPMAITILLTGANGLLGQKLTDLLSHRKGVELIATSKGPNRNPQRNGYTYQQLDITVEAEVNAVFDTYKPEVLIHSAAMTHVDQCELNPDACELNNVTATQYLADACNRHGCKMIFLSTDFIFDGKDGPYKEDAQPAPLSVYGHAKWRAEQIVQQMTAPWAIARTVLIYGVVSGLSRTNIVLWVKDSLTQKKQINVVHDQWRSPTLAEDLADGVASIAMLGKTGIYHISGAEFMSVLELAQRVADFWKLDRSLITPIDSTTLSQPAKRPPRTGFIILKAQTELDYKPHPLENGLELLSRQL